MKIRTDRRKGQPLVMLATLLLVWVCFRVVSWESPLPQILPQLAERQLPRGPTLASARPGPTVLERVELESPPITRLEQLWAPEPVLQEPLERDPGTPLDPVGMPPAIAGGHQLLWMAAMSQLPIPSELHRSLAAPARNAAQAPVFAGLPAPSRQRGPDRWSMDGWVFLRDGSQAPAFAGVSPGSYGASQAGAVLRYRFAPHSAFRPFAFVRATAALTADREKSIAFGAGGQPVAALPITVNAEMRVSQAAGRTQIRPAGFAVIQPDRIGLPAGFQAEAYAQAGYVGGDFATGFADGQLRVTRDLATFDLARVQAGGGVWGGAQKGAERLDIGPTASVDVKLGDVPARLAVDYRVRIAGDATPGSGAAITLSTGF